MKLTQKNTKKHEKTEAVRIRIDVGIKSVLSEIAKKEHRSFARQVGYCCEQWIKSQGDGK